MCVSKCFTIPKYRNVLTIESLDSQQGADQKFSLLETSEKTTKGTIREILRETTGGHACPISYPCKLLDALLHTRLV